MTQGMKFNSGYFSFIQGRVEISIDYIVVVQGVAGFIRRRMEEDGDVQEEDGGGWGRP